MSKNKTLIHGNNGYIKECYKLKIASLLPKGSGSHPPQVNKDGKRRSG